MQVISAIGGWGGPSQGRPGQGLWRENSIFGRCRGRRRRGGGLVLHFCAVAPRRGEAGSRAGSAAGGLPGTTARRGTRHMSHNMWHASIVAPPGSGTTGGTGTHPPSSGCRAVGVPRWDSPPPGRRAKTGGGEIESSRDSPRSASAPNLLNSKSAGRGGAARPGDRSGGSKAGEQKKKKKRCGIWRRRLSSPPARDSGPESGTSGSNSRGGAEDQHVQVAGCMSCAMSCTMSCPSWRACWVAECVPAPAGSGCHPLQWSWVSSEEIS